VIEALVLAPATERERIITGLTLAERARRVAVRAGVPSGQVHTVRSADELRGVASRFKDGTRLLVLRATEQLVAAPLVEPLLDKDSGSPRVAVDAAGYAGAMLVEGAQVPPIVTLLQDDFTSGDAKVAASWPGVERVQVGRRARFPVSTDADLRAADAWQFELVNKPLDSFLCVYVYRPVARPLTRLFLRSPLSPNAITILSTVLGLVGCAIAASPSRGAHIVGMALLLLGGIVDACDGEVARLRLESSTLGGYLDAMGDDLSRLGLLFAAGVHVGYLHPDLPITWLTWGALLATLVSMVPIYWYCILVLHSSNWQDYTLVLGVGPGIDAAPGQRRSLGRTLADWGTQIARRDFIDLAVLILALVHLPEVSFVGMALGSVIGLVVVIPAHFKIMRTRRAARRGAGATG
jgi:phosphatidylglycerophosphate synthase